MAGISMSGWLDKRGGQDASKGWKSRWCILNDCMLRYYKTETDNTAAGTLFGEDIDDIVEDLFESQKDSAKFGFVFRIVTKGRDFIFNAANGDIRNEWIKTLKKLLSTYRPEGPQVPSVRYATVEVFVNKGIRINGEVTSVLQAQLTPPSCKTTTDERGWFCDYAPSHTNILNLFTQHGWSLATAFQCNTFLSDSKSISPSDTLVFTRPNS